MILHQSLNLQKRWQIILFPVNMTSLENVSTHQGVTVLRMPEKTQAGDD